MHRVERSSNDVVSSSGLNGGHAVALPKLRALSYCELMGCACVSETHHLSLDRLSDGFRLRLYPSYDTRIALAWRLAAKV